MTQNANFVKKDPMFRASPFRTWIYNRWADNREERLIYKEEYVTIKQYWDTYKWWLKKEFKQQRHK
jgi:hypothetical protein